MGKNINGSLGVVGSNQTELHPVLIDLNLNSNVKKIIAGNYRSFLLTESGELYAWGNNYQGMLGLGEIMIIQKPKKINERMKLGIGETIIDISSSYSHAIILTNFGKIYTFGRNDAAQIGLGIIDQEFYDLTLLNIDFKLVVNESITNVYTTSDSTAVLTSNGRVIVWGRSVFNYNIINYSAQDITNLFGLERDEKITKMFDGSYNLAAISNSGKTWIWGQPYPGMIGNVKDSHSTPQLIQLSLINGEIIEEVSFGSQFTTLRTNLGNVYTSGINTSGQLGNGEKDQYFSYYGFRKINLEKITAVFSRNTLTLALDRSGILHFWGSDDHNNYYFSTVSFLPLRIN
jgi:alpha-tubulin suppressor-like RCC1 family protein